MWQTAGGWLDFNPSTHTDAHLACRLCYFPPHPAVDMTILYLSKGNIEHLWLSHTLAYAQHPGCFKILRGLAFQALKQNTRCTDNE